MRANRLMLCNQCLGGRQPEWRARGDEFAANLLMPLHDFRRQLDPKDHPDFAAIRAMVDRNGVSLTAAILRWLEYTETRVIMMRDDRMAATSTNQVWAMDFVHDQLATGRKIRVLTIVDTFSRYAPSVDPRFSYRGEDVVETLEKSAGT